MAKIHKLDDFTWHLTKLMPDNKVAPAGALCLKVKVKNIGESGMLVTAGCTIEQYERTAKLLRVNMHKQANAPIEMAPEFVRKVFDKQSLSMWQKFVNFIKKILWKR